MIPQFDYQGVSFPFTSYYLSSKHLNNRCNSIITSILYKYVFLKVTYVEMYAIISCQPKSRARLVPYLSRVLLSLERSKVKFYALCYFLLCSLTYIRSVSEEVSPIFRVIQLV